MNLEATGQRVRASTPFLFFTGVAVFIFFAQSMMAELDMPAMLFTVLALVLFLDNRIVAAALASVALVMLKETGLVASAIFGAFLCFEKRRRVALWFLLPLVPLGLWLLA